MHHWQYRDSEKITHLKIWIGVFIHMKPTKQYYAAVYYAVQLGLWMNDAAI